MIIVDQFEINDCSPYQCNHYRVCVHSWRVWFCLDGSGRLVPKDWSEEPACGSALDWCTDTWWAVSRHYQWLTGIRSEPTPLILRLCSSCVCLREHACCHHSCRIIYINVHHQLSNFEIIQNVFAIACQSEIMTVFPSRRNSWAFQRRGDWRHCVGCESWGPSRRTAGQQGELLEILYWPSSTTSHGLVFQSFPSLDIIVHFDLKIRSVICYSEMMSRWAASSPHLIVSFQDFVFFRIELCNYRMPQFFKTRNNGSVQSDHYNNQSCRSRLWPRVVEFF